MTAIVAVCDVFSRQCERTPEAPAVHDGHRVLSYRQLDSRSDALASQLDSLGIGVGDQVGICVDRSVDLSIALLATLKTGATYVPLDPGYPPARLHMMLRDSGAQLVLLSAAREPLFSPDIPKLRMEEQYAQGMPAPAFAATPEQLVYIIYTSGSTGTPKGVAMPNRALLNLIQWQAHQPGFASPARVAQFTPLSFDVHFQEFFSTWASGGTVYCISDEARRDPARLLAFITQYAIERLFLPFVALRQLLAFAISYGPLPTSLKDIVTAGEQLQIDPAITEFFYRVPHCRLHNQYGPSETHVVTAYTMPSEVAAWPTLPPIGRAITNTEIFILDEALQPVGAGREGELCVGGDCLAAGYWQQVEASTERFVDYPPASGGRLYRTGDLARLDHDGTYHYAGRIDGQVKIRGHRVECGEVESQIKRHPEIRDCAVIASSTANGDNRLLAYLVLDAHPRGKLDSRQSEQLAQWQDVWDGTYQQTAGTSPRFDISGWNSSFTGQPLPADDMRQWVDGTATRILALKPRRVLEIGAGTGLILYQVAPHCSYYHATDYSRVAVDHLQRELSSAQDLSAELKTSTLAAHQLDQLAGEHLDTIIINSVTQHFVSLDYLLDVLRQASELLRNGGHIFLGDVTSLNTRALFATAVECFRAAPNDRSETLSGRIQRRLADEQELVLDPALFYRLPELIDRIRAVEIRLKPGSYDNELAQFRYDVVLAVGDHPTMAHPQTDWLDWDRELSTEAIAALVANSNRRPLGIRGIPNARLQHADALARCLASGQYAQAKDLRLAAAALVDKSVAIHPDALFDLERPHHCRVQLLWSDNPACFDALIAPADTPLFHCPPTTSAKPLPYYASQPFNISALPSIIADLRRSLAARLPDYMLPARYIPLSRLPTTPSGKLDRRALPQPSSERPALEQEYTAPQGTIETGLAAIWGEMLDIDAVGVNDNFFDLGGNSILSLRLGMEIRSRLGEEVLLVTLFQHPTIRSLAGHLTQQEKSSAALTDAVKSRASKQRQAFARGKRLAKATDP